MRGAAGAGICLRIVTALGVAALAACGGERRDAARSDGVQGPFVWGSADDVTRVGQLWLSGQPDDAGLRAAKKNGVTWVIDLRAPGERDWDEAAAAKAAGLQYENIPVEPGKPFVEAAFAEISELVESHPDDQILLHGSAGNRAAAWLTTELVRKDGMPFAEALEIGRRAGITKPEVVAKTAALLGEKPPKVSHEAAPASPAEPGRTPG
jgi:protein tyrosine phosphatase (PTP) superfamily phosphohydrolase (DUF442 family)